MSASDFGSPGSPGSAAAMSDPPPESGQRPHSSGLLSHDEDEDDDSLPYPEEQQRVGGGNTPGQEENWESSVYGGEDEGGALSGDESDFQKFQDDDDRLPAIERENKYRGPASTWRYWTRHERQESSAIETSRARDLAIHLFNAYALKRRAVGMKIREEQREPDEIRAMAAEASWSSFRPPNRWIAWPLPANEVPRTDHRVFKDEWTLRMEADLRPSAELEESLLAEMMKNAKERFEGREWKRTRPKTRRKAKKETPEGSGVEQTTEDGEDLKSDIDMDAEVEFRPVVSADDEASKRNLRPAARHIISRFDNLLLSLHYARKAYNSREDRSRPGTATETEAENISVSKSSPKKRRLRSASRSQSRGRKRTRPSPAANNLPSESESGSEYVGSEKSASRASSASQSLSRRDKGVRRRTTSGTDRKDRVGLRDWGDIVGIASMTGWPKPVVMRTAQRCARLFGEDMQFRTFDEEETLQGTQGEKALSSNAESSAESCAGSRSKSRKGKGRTVRSAASLQTPRRAKVFCPVEGCPRQKNGFSRTWNLNLHLKRVHSTSKSLVGGVSGTDKGDTEEK